MGKIRTQKKYCDFKCWHAAGNVCACWCLGVNHGIGRVPEGFDPKYGLTEEEYLTKQRSERASADQKNDPRPDSGGE